MPVHKVCQNFFRDALAPFHQYRQNALMDATMALINGASLTQTSIGRFLPGNAQVKNKIKRIDRLMGNDSNLLIVFYVQIMPDDLVMQLHRF
ncbi:ISSfl3 ORF [Shigella flexneri]|nr:ISSfl3 ORF [Shigella flexneri]